MNVFPNLLVSWKKQTPLRSPHPNKAFPVACECEGVPVVGIAVGLRGCVGNGVQGGLQAVVGGFAVLLLEHPPQRPKDFRPQLEKLQFSRSCV